ncbi:hypothetical protein DSM25559_4506 [Agrobacterium rosae]|uniref:Uncharacterized protein n=1 Tax=Agrobacterium rosae TaxID=1972867 RepID=A0A1R3U196_9HYPH|nr:hypothetical protein DSM25559_4506 [Agrobacterium rosae]
MGAEISTILSAHPPVRLVFSSTPKPQPSSSAYAFHQLAEESRISSVRSPISAAVEFQQGPPVFSFCVSPPDPLYWFVQKQFYPA